MSEITVSSIAVTLERLGGAAGGTAAAIGEPVLRVAAVLRRALLDPVHHVLDAYLLRSELRALDDGLLDDLGLHRE